MCSEATRQHLEISPIKYMVAQKKQTHADELQIYQEPSAETA